MKTYTAISKPGNKFIVCEIIIGFGHPDKFNPIIDIREFSSFDEADKVAQNLAAGKYPDIREPGRYISMR